MAARMFAAVLPPPSVVEEIDAYLEPRREAGRAIWRWTRPESYHVTTAFMASVAPRAQLGLEAGLAEVAAGRAPFRLRLAKAVCFPAPERAKLLALAVEGGDEDLAELSRACRTAASRAGVQPDGSRFVGHLTLGRANPPVEATRWVYVVDSFPGWEWDVTEVVLVQSHLTDKGNRYEVVDRWPLGGGRPGGEVPADGEDRR